MSARLLSIPEAAESLNVPVTSLRTVADEHGLTIRMGRAVRLHPHDLDTLVKLCRVAPSAPASTSGESLDRPRTMRSETPAASPSLLARAAAEKLKRPSRTTSNGSTAQPVQLRRKT